MPVDDNTPKLKVNPTDADNPAPPFDAGRAIMRLMVGATLEGGDALIARLREWEREAFLGAQQAATAPTADDRDRLRYAAIGALFLLRERIERDALYWLREGERRAQLALDRADRLSDWPLLRQIKRPIKSRIIRWRDQLRDDFAYWVRVGQLEEGFSRGVSRRAFDALVDDVITVLADNPELQELVQQQSIGLATEVVDNVREVTVTADTIVEDIVRRILRRTPRRDLPLTERQLRALSENDDTQ